MSAAVDPFAVLEAATARQPGFDLATADLLGDPSDEGAALRRLQRIWRIEPTLAGAAVLHAAGLDSAHRITTGPRSTFVATFAERLEGGAEHARRVYDRALAVKTRVAHVFASVRSAIASPHARALKSYAVAPTISEYFQDLSSYQEIFGSLDYAEVADGDTILDPAAYLVDLLRVIELAVTTPNTIRPGLKLFDRRPDIGRLALTAENTNDQVRYLQIVVRTLTQLLQSRMGIAPLPHLAESFFPPNLPYHQPLDRIRAYLTFQGQSAADILGAFRVGAKPDVAESAAYLGLSLEQKANVVEQPEALLAAIVSANYGESVDRGALGDLDHLDAYLARAGLQQADVEPLFTQGLSGEEIFDVSGTYSGSGGFAASFSLVHKGRAVTGTFAQGGIIKATASGPDVVGYFERSAPGQAVYKGDFALTLSDDGATFTGRYRENYQGEWLTWDGTHGNGGFTGGLIPGSFYINRPLPVSEYLRIAVTESAPTKIAGQKLETLDRLNRFRRLAQAMDVSFPELNWLLVSLTQPKFDDAGKLCCETRIDDTTLIELAKVRRLELDHSMRPDLAVTMWFDLRTIGRGDGTASVAPFDLVFNGADPLARTSEPYRPAIAEASTSYPNPLYTGDTITWIIGENDGRAADLVAALPGSMDDAATIAKSLFGDAEVPLTVANLSALYRHLSLARHLALPTANYVILLRDLGLVRSSEDPRLSATLNRDHLLMVLAAAEWITAAGISAPVLDVCLGHTNPYAASVYSAKAIPALSASLSQSLASELVTAQSFGAPGVSAVESNAYFQALANAGYLDTLGLVVKDATAAALRPVLDSAVYFEPSIAKPSEAQCQAVADSLVRQAKAQQGVAIQCLANYFAASQDLMQAVLAGVAAWNVRAGAAGPYSGFVEPLVLGEALTPIDAGSVVKNGILDKGLLIDAFAKQGVVLSAEAAIVSRAATVWTITETVTRRTYLAVSADLAAVSYYDGQVRLFSDALDAVCHDGVFDIAELIEVFAANGIALPSDLEVKALVVPTSWIIDDPTSGARYLASQADAGGKIVVSRSLSDTGMKTEHAEALLHPSSCFVTMSRALGLSPAAVAAYCQEPGIFDPKASSRPQLSVGGIEAAFALTRLVEAFDDTDDRLVAYLVAAAGVAKVTPVPDLDRELCAVTGWDVKQCADAREKLEISVVWTIEQLGRMQRLFSLCGAIGSDLATLEGIRSVLFTAAEDSYDAADGVAARLADLTRADTDAGTWSVTLAQIESPVEDRLRDALVATSIELLGKSFTDLRDARDLYEYLLLDIEMGTVAQVSPVVEAINAAQLYLQRCRLNLEPDIRISEEDLPAIWWDWLLDFRSWQLNREVFLYPENYLDPTLRSTRTQLFRSLQDRLLQVQATQAVVEGEFKSYFNDLDQVARLDIVDTCKAWMESGPMGEREALALVARTRSEPYKFYSARRDRLAHSVEGAWDTWTEWSAIDLNINSDRVTTAYAFDRFVLFWSEIETQQQLRGDNDSTFSNFTLATTYYAYADASGAWTPAQCLWDDQVLFASGIWVNNFPFQKEFDAQTPLPLSKITCLPVGGKLMVYHGPIMDELWSAFYDPALDPAPYQRNPRTVEFIWSIHQATFAANQRMVYNRDVHKELGPTWPKVPVFFPATLDSRFQRSSLSVSGSYPMLRIDAATEVSGPLFGLGMSGTTLNVSPQLGRSSLYQLGTNATALPNPVPSRDPGKSPVVSTAFASRFNADVCNRIVEALVRGPAPLLDAGGYPLVAADQLTLEAVVNSLGESWTLDTARLVREVILAASLGNLTLLDRVLGPDAATRPVNNQPGSYTLTNDGETFLIEPVSAGGKRFPTLDRGISVETNSDWFTPRSLISPAVDARHGWTYAGQLIGSRMVSGYGQIGAAKTATAETIAYTLTIDMGRAEPIRALLASGGGPDLLAYDSGSFGADDSLYNLCFEFQRIGSTAIDRLSSVLTVDGVEALLALEQQQSTYATKRFDLLGPIATPQAIQPNIGAPVIKRPDLPYGDQVDFGGAFGQYFWELFFHVPWLIAKSLHDNQQFADAQRWLSRIFDPTTPPQPLTKPIFVGMRPPAVSVDDAGFVYDELVFHKYIDESGQLGPAVPDLTVAIIQELSDQRVKDPLDAVRIVETMQNWYAPAAGGRYWRFLPFRCHELESLLDQLKNPVEIAAYNEHPFDPDVIARLRIDAYQKAIVMFYIQNLIDWGDSEFTKYTWESVTTARMLYIRAYDLLGKRPQNLGPARTRPSTTFDDILLRYGGAGAIPQFLIDLENAPGGAPPDGPYLRLAGRPYNDLGALFQVPENSKLTGYWDLVEDRLFKIRNSLNINGQAQPLPSFGAKLGGLAAIRAGARSGDVLGLSGQRQPLVHHYRFAVLIERASEAAEATRGFGAQLLAALERGDAEGLAQLQMTHAVAILNAMTRSKQLTVLDLEKQRDALSYALTDAETRRGHYAALVKDGMIPAECTALALFSAAMISRGIAAFILKASSPAYAVPSVFGLANGGMDYGSSIAAWAGVAHSAADVFAQGASISQSIGEFQRRSADWSLQASLAGIEVQEQARQIEAMSARIEGAVEDLRSHVLQVANSGKELRYMQTKFTSQELYAWMAGRLSAIYLQSYRLAQDLALAAQTSYQFELDRTDEFITLGSWEDQRRGLVAGEGLSLTLGQMRKAYLDADARRLEIVKTISLRQAFPEAFIAFKWGFSGEKRALKGQLDFALGETLFDFDHPGHYCRKIRSVSVSIPCLLGPYQNLNATLTQRFNAVVTEPRIDGVEYLKDLESKGAGARAVGAVPASVRENWAPSQGIAISEGTDDDGLFVLDFNDPRYLPFESTGAVSSWTFSLPPETNLIDFDSIADVIVTIRYTAKDGGPGFASQVKRLYTDRKSETRRFVNASFNLSRSFASQWQLALRTKPVEGKQTVSFPIGTGIVLPNLRSDVRIERVILQLEVAGGTPAKDGDGPFLSLAIGEAAPVPVRIVNNCGHLERADLGPGAFYGVNWSLIFDAGKAPSVLKTGGALDPAKLLDVFLIIEYTASPF